MGGIVVRKFIVERAIELIGTKKEIDLFLIASPSLGSSYADWLSPLAQLFGHPQADALRFVRNNSWLVDLDKEFFNLKESGRLKIRGKELAEDKFVILPYLWRRQVVESFSGARYFGERYKVAASDHFSIAKPADKNAVQHRLLCQFILENALSPRVPAPESRSQQPVENERSLNEGKLILVGRGGVGKTSLVQRLVENRFRGDEPETQGINITNWPLLCGSAVRLNIWDFGGQEIMHATHRFFLTQRSLYVIVLNGREDVEDLDAEYWLKHIEGFGGDSPVIIVQNKIHQHPFDLNYRGLRARYSQISGFVKTDCKEGFGLEELREVIQKAIKNLPTIHMQFPMNWFNVKAQVESMKDDFMGYEGFREICHKQGIKDNNDIDTLCFVFHCLGIALNYSEDSRLHETSVLKPEWVTKGIYTILNSKTLAERKGELNLNELKNILPKDRYPIIKHHFLTEFMRKFTSRFRMNQVDTWSPTF